MSIEGFREYCLSLEGTIEEMKWDRLCFTIEGKIFVILDVEAQCFSLKCEPDVFDNLVALDGCIQAPHFAKRQWVCINGFSILSPHDLKQLIRQSRCLVISKLSKSIQRKYGIA